ncbi:hypothetical protein [Halobaculum gomorrense]|uniref:Uncharacterized protein n=1 Tax=Halobaculum gomorrense TaxID=43928 RepID=A0A1M5MMZ4_9EURY|nr:hypothetical protein [Halobaculum gomorrense]SHG78641.1 hypothetical protein SAMN05443636_1071 [Halobaculum gomorrense]
MNEVELWHSCRCLLRRLYIDRDRGRLSTRIRVALGDLHLDGPWTTEEVVFGENGGNLANSPFANSDFVDNHLDSE